MGYACDKTLGINLHSCIAVTPEGLPLGIAGQSYYTREENKDKRTSHQKQSSPIEEKESFRWIEMMRETIEKFPKNAEALAICDREGDFYELYAEAMELGTNFVIRVKHDRKSDDNEKIVTKLRKTEPIGRVTVTIPRDTRNSKKMRDVEMEVAFVNVSVKRSQYSDKKLPAKLNINLIRITEITDKDDKIEWVLATNLEVGNAEDCIEIVGYYVQRWKIERFHFVLKSGYNVERIQQRTVGKVEIMLLIYSVLAMFIMNITFLARVSPDLSCDLVLDDTEWKFLHRIVNKTKIAPDKPYSIQKAVEYIGRLGGYKHYPSDGNYGLKSVWQGFFRLFDSIDILVAQV